MTRIIKAAAERQAEFLDHAQALFFSRGYEATTVNDIIERAGLSKGAFYHHFASKEALLDALIERITAQVLANAQDILDDPDLDALARLNGLLAETAHWKIERVRELMVLFEFVLKPENVLLYQRIVSASAQGMTPVLTRIVEEGVREGVFDVPAAGLVAEILLQLAQSRRAVVIDALAAAERGDLEAATGMLEARISAEEAVIARLLGVPSGALRLVEPGFVRAILEAMR
jgi:AcrR family transcriptional regulator